MQHDAFGDLDFAMLDVPGRPLRRSTVEPEDMLQTRLEEDGHGVEMVLDGQRHAGPTPGRARPAYLFSSLQEPA